MIVAVESLYALSFLDDKDLMARLGWRIVVFPLEPPLSKVLLTSIDLSCSIEAITILAMMTADSNSAFNKPRERLDEADRRKAQFHDSRGDHLTLLNDYNGRTEAEDPNGWCKKNYIHARYMAKAKNIRDQLVGIMDKRSYD